MTSESSGTRRDRHHVMDGLFLVTSVLLVPRLGMLLWTAVAWWQGRKFKVNEALAPVKWAQAAISFIAILIIFVLLGAVFAGKMFAVEAAATDRWIAELVLNPVLSPQPMSAQDIDCLLYTSPSPRD